MHPLQALFFFVLQEAQPSSLLCLRRVLMAKPMSRMMTRATMVLEIMAVSMLTSQKEKGCRADEQRCNIGESGLPEDGEEELAFTAQLLEHGTDGCNAWR